MRAHLLPLLFALLLLALVARATAFVAYAPPQRPAAALAAARTPLQTARRFYDSWNRGDVADAGECLDDNVEFLDANNKRPFYGKREVVKYLQDCSDALNGWQFVIDDSAEDKQRNRLGLKWHVEDSKGNPLPFPSRGLSFLRFNEEGLIVFCEDYPEPTAKIGSLQLPLLRLVTKVLVR